MFLPHNCDRSNTTEDDTDEEQRDPPNRTSLDSRKTGKPKAHQRVFLHTPLHDYESVWWIATWILFKCRPKSPDSEEPGHLARPPVSSVMRMFDDMTVRERMFLAHGIFLRLKEALAPILHPLFEILEVFRQELARVYREYEKSFDGSIILRNVERFHQCLKALAEAATQIEILDFPRTTMIDPSTTRLYLSQDASDGREVDLVNDATTSRRNHDIGFPPPSRNFGSQTHGGELL
jgi:hypothetical protein